jgi:hypothetical protein
MDIDAIAPGEDFREAIARTMHICDVILVVIGPAWASSRDEAGNRRLDDEGDVHRAEIQTALASHTRVIPVLVGDATMPKSAELPAPLQELAYRNAAVIEDRRFVPDVNALIDSMRPFVGGPASDTGRSSSTATASPPAGDAIEPVPGSIRAPGRGLPRLLGNTPLSWRLAVPVLGAVLILLYGILLPRDWHNEFWSTRAVSSLVLLGVTAVAVRNGQRTGIALGGVIGLGGLLLWMLRLVSTHDGEVGELFAFSQDGVPNILTFIGALMVTVGAWLSVPSSVERLVQ